jgi:hypothetical protein
VVEANAAIFNGAHTNAAQRGMGTTLTGITMLRPADDAEAARLVLLNVGDSRGYLYRNGTLRRATIDHSYVQELVATGHITEDEARTHPRRNIVTRALGIEPSVRVDSWVLPVVRGDRFILCSDGLVDEVDDAQITSIIAAATDPQAAADELVTTANANGGRDNVTVLVIDVVEGIDAPADDDALEDTATWAGAGGLGSLVDADAGSITEAAPTSLAQLAGGDTPISTMRPAAGRRRFGIGTLLFGIALGLIVTVTIVFIAAAITNSDDDEQPTVTTVLPSTTTLPTSTTVAPATTTVTVPVTPSRPPTTET